MKRILFAWCIGSFPALASAIDITVGGTELSIPAPSGFSPITSDMKPYAEFALRFVPESNEQFALFLSDEDTASAARGKIPHGERRFYVQTTKSFIQPFVSSADFAEIKRVIKTQNAEILRKAKSQISDAFEHVNKGLSNDYNVDLALAVNQMVPLPPHAETERSMSYSMILKYDANDAHGKPTTFERVVTATFVHLRGKILFLYVDAEKAGLDWSRTESQKWADAIIAANPSVGAIATREASQGRSGIDWGRVGEKGLIGAIVGGLFGLVRYLFKKKKSKQAINSAPE